MFFDHLFHCNRKPVVEYISYEEWLQHYWGNWGFLHDNSLEKAIYSGRMEIIKSEIEVGNPFHRREKIG